VAQLKTDPQKAFLGIGWNFPPQVNTSGSMQFSEYEQDVQQSIRIILGTNPGERVMRPDFGAGLNQFVFEPVNQATMNAVSTQVREALIDWEPRITLMEVNVTTDPTQMNCLLIDIEYQIRASNTTTNLVYPFFLMEGGTF
jgi:phage baseplate assembly protein W